MYAISVIFEIKPQSMGAFLDLMLTQAKTSLEVEKDCLVFDVCQAVDQPNTVFLYERYKDESAFQAHLKSAHFLAFDAQVADMVVSKVITSFNVLSEA